MLSPANSVEGTISPVMGQFLAIKPDMGSLVMLPLLEIQVVWFCHDTVGVKTLAIHGNGRPSHAIGFLALFSRRSQR